LRTPIEPEPAFDDRGTLNIGAPADLATMELTEGPLESLDNYKGTRAGHQHNFLGYSFGRMYLARTGKPYPGFRPSKKSIGRMVETIHALTARSQTWRATTELVEKLNRTCRFPASGLYGAFFVKVSRHFCLPL
jgi:hypothetical protein